MKARAVRQGVGEWRAASGHEAAAGPVAATTATERISSATCFSQAPTRRDPEVTELGSLMCTEKPMSITRPKREPASMASIQGGGFTATRQGAKQACLNNKKHKSEFDRPPHHESKLHSWRSPDARHGGVRGSAKFAHERCPLNLVNATVQSRGATATGSPPARLPPIQGRGGERRRNNSTRGPGLPTGTPPCRRSAAP